MTPEQRAKLEEMANEQYGTSYMDDWIAFMNGAEAAFGMRDAEIAELSERPTLDEHADRILSAEHWKTAHDEAVKETLDVLGVVRERDAEVAELKERLAFSGAGECGLEGWECKKARMEAVREAVEKERKRCYRIITDTFAGDERTPCAWDKILNPAESKEGA